jgi:hypothetical protein
MDTFIQKLQSKDRVAMEYNTADLQEEARCVLVVW